MVAGATISMDMEACSHHLHNDVWAVAFSLLLDRSSLIPLSLEALLQLLEA